MAQSKKSSLRVVRSKKDKEQSEKDNKTGWVIRTKILLLLEYLANLIAAYDRYKRKDETETLNKLSFLLLTISENVQKSMKAESKELVQSRVDFMYSMFNMFDFIPIEKEQEALAYIETLINLKKEEKQEN